MPRRKPIKNEWKGSPPTAKEIKAAQVLAKRVSRTLLALMEAKTKNAA